MYVYFTIIKLQRIVQTVAVKQKCCRYFAKLLKLLLDIALKE